MGLGNMGGIISSLTFQSSQAPFYDMGYRANLGPVCAAMVLATGYVVGGIRGRGIICWRGRRGIIWGMITLLLGMGSRGYGL